MNDPEQGRINCGLKGLDKSLIGHKRQSQGFDQSLTEYCKNHLIIRLHCLPPDTGYHTHTHYKIWYLFLYFGIFHPKYIIMLVLCLVLAKIVSINFHSR